MSRRPDPGTPWGGRFTPVKDRRIIPTNSRIPELCDDLREAIMDDELWVRHIVEKHQSDPEGLWVWEGKHIISRLQRFAVHLEHVTAIYDEHDWDSQMAETLCYNEATGYWFNGAPYRRVTKDLTPAKRKKFDQEERDRRRASAKLLARAAKKLRDEEQNPVTVHKVDSQEDWDLAMEEVADGDVIQLPYKLDGSIEYRGNPFDPTETPGDPITIVITREGPPQ